MYEITYTATEAVLKPTNTTTDRVCWLLYTLQSGTDEEASFKTGARGLVAEVSSNV